MYLKPRIKGYELTCYNAELRSHVLWLASQRIPVVAQLNDQKAWATIRAAQGLLKSMRIPTQAWEGPRVLRTALQIGWTRPLYAEMSFSTGFGPILSVSQRFGYFFASPNGIDRHQIPQVASALINVATACVHRERFCESFGFSSDEADILLDQNDYERSRWHIMCQALAFWNTASWLRDLKKDNYVLTDCSDQIWTALNALRRSPKANLDFALSVARCVKRQIEPLGKTGTKLPIFAVRGPWVGSAIDHVELAPRILGPLVDALKSVNVLYPPYN